VADYRYYTGSVVFYADPDDDKAKSLDLIDRVLNDMATEFDWQLFHYETFPRPNGDGTQRSAHFVLRRPYEKEWQEKAQKWANEAKQQANARIKGA
jgi:hypothetical protein